MAHRYPIPGLIIKIDPLTVVRPKTETLVARKTDIARSIETEWFRSP